VDGYSTPEFLLHAASSSSNHGSPQFCDLCGCRRLFHDFRMLFGPTRTEETLLYLSIHQAHHTPEASLQRSKRQSLRLQMPSYRPFFRPVVLYQVLYQLGCLFNPSLNEPPNQFHSLSKPTPKPLLALYLPTSLPSNSLSLSSQVLGR
jgi:hypothetical protein